VQILTAEHASLYRECEPVRTAAAVGEWRRSRRLAAADERSAWLRCLVIVNRSSDLVDLAERVSTPARSLARRDAAFLLLANEQLDRAYRLARAILHDAVEAQDATHDAFVQAWRKWDSLRDPERFEPWFDRILVNTCRNRLRTNRWHATDISPKPTLVTSDHVSGAEDRQLIAAAIASLSPDHRIVVALRFYRDLTVPDIAARLGVPVGTVRSRLHYALKRLHDAIAPADGQGADR
jgi:RNA polymerase sigma-70 factor, ECF subfamily